MFTKEFQQTIAQKISQTNCKWKMAQRNVRRNLAQVDRRTGL